MLDLGCVQPGYLDDLSLRACAGDDGHGVPRHLERRGQKLSTAALARPFSGAASTRTFQPSPWRPTSSVAFAPGDTVTVIRPTGSEATIRAWRIVRQSSETSRRSGPSSPGSVITFDPERLRTRVDELERELGAPGFWDDQQHAARVSEEHSRLSRRLDRYESLEREASDLRELLDPLRAGRRAGRGRAPVEALQGQLKRVEEDALFNGEYDAGDSVVSIHAGTGGTDAQDWAEILLRMYMRWAADRGFRVELLEASPGEEAGLKSATFTVHGENAYGTLKAERGVHRLVRLSPFDQATAATRASRR